MRKLRLLAALLAMTAVVLVSTASPAIAWHDDDGWWDDCEWAWTWEWGWVVVCDVDDDWSEGSIWWDEDWDDEDWDDWEDWDDEDWDDEDWDDDGDMVDVFVDVDV